MATAYETYSDEGLVLAALVGSLDAFDELARRYRRALISVAYRVVRQPEAAEDVVQDALILAFKALPQLDDASRFGGWLRAITSRQALEYARRGGRVEYREDVDELILASTRHLVATPAQQVDADETMRQLRDAVDALDADHRQVVQLYYWADMPQKRIAAFLDLPVTTVQWRLHTARKHLRERLAVAILQSSDGEPVEAVGGRDVQLYLGRLRASA
ncbi:sigma-70 family RNA polymerase sigma factor, partial [Candidatus Poribacteria bacterium]|nr:sigma-70 family RNA polymerase sigma factor [Candidatus Poribacteria bacterium]